MKSTNPAYVVVDHNELTDKEEFFAEQFGAKVIGQPGALKVASLAYNLANNPLRNRERPIGVFLFAGKSRRGKSHSARILAELFHGSAKALTRLQASDYQEDHQFLDLKGAPPTYVGYKDPKDPKNKLADDEIDPTSVISAHNLRRVRLGSNMEVDIVVVEEWEKASKDFYKLFMGIFDNGYLRLGNGQIVDFTNTIFILTSNIGMDDLERKEKHEPIGFVKAAKKVTTHEDVVKCVHEALQSQYKPEFRNRLDAVVVFEEFTAAVIDKIVDAELGLLQDRINAQMPPAQDFLLMVTDAAKKHLLKLCDSNVAQLKNFIEREFTMPLGRLVNGNKLKGGDIVRIDVVDDTFKFEIAEGAWGVSESENYLKMYGKVSEDNVSALGMQREIRKARATAKTDGVEEYQVVLKSDSRGEMMEGSADLIRDMEQVVGVEVPMVAYSREAPFSFIATVRASKKQVEILRRLDARIEVRPISRALVPVKK